MADLSAAIAANMSKTSTPAATPEAKAAPAEAPKAPVEPAKAAPKADKAPAVEEPTPAQKKVWKLKAAGKEVDFDASDEERVKQAITKGLGADARFEEAAALRKQAEQAFEMLKDPAQLKKLLADPRIGIDFKKLAEEAVWESIQEDKLAPEEKKAREVQRELERYKEQEQKATTEREENELKALQAQHEADWEKRIFSALETGSVPNTRGTVRRMAHYIGLAVANDMEVPSAQELAARVRQDLLDEHREMYSAADATSLISVLGEDLAKKIREADIKRLKSTRPASQQRITSNAKPVKQPERRKGSVSADAFAAMLKEKLGQG